MLDELGIGMGESVPEAPKEMHAKEQKSGEKHRGEIDICGKEFFFLLFVYWAILQIYKRPLRPTVLKFTNFLTITESDPVLSELEIRLNNLRQT